MTIFLSDAEKAEINDMFYDVFHNIVPELFWGWFERRNNGDGFSYECSLMGEIEFWDTLSPEEQACEP